MDKGTQVKQFVEILVQDTDPGGGMRSGPQGESGHPGQGPSGLGAALPNGCIIIFLLLLLSWPASRENFHSSSLFFLFTYPYTKYLRLQFFPFLQVIFQVPETKGSLSISLQKLRDFYI